MVSKGLQMVGSTRRKRIVLVVFLVFAVLFIAWINKQPKRKELTFQQRRQQMHLTEVDNDEYLTLVPEKTIKIWESSKYLVAAGIPSIDNKERFRRRGLQRSTCWTYGGVATRRNDFAGDLIPLYLLSPHERNDFILSDSVRAEAQKNHDIIVLPTFDVPSTNGKVIGELQSWGNEVELVMSKKTYLWLKFASNFFGTATYIMKADDDLFIRVPYYLSSLKLMPKHRLYMGWYGLTPEVFVDRWVPFIAGYCVTLSRDVADGVVNYSPLQRLVNTPYSESNIEDFREMAMFNEDVMVAVTLREKVGYSDLVTADIGRCHYISHLRRRLSKVVTEKTMVVHHIKEKDYGYLMKLFPNNSETPPPVVLQWKDKNFARGKC
uniref:Hexosyltransferase n=1 Tax=Trypanosoma brucei TaxID=5691 RepID=V5NBQ4_9TRYP|nr:galactosyltransferase [Trypanosoma brucei]